jgi:peptidoglycan/xylan/chitin deacetylase (PgdA/CDA1 family)
MIPHKTPLLLQKLYPDLIWKKTEKVYLTFDDGPIPEVTDFVIKTLNDFKIKATFFCIGDNVQKHPDVFQRVISEGHSVGNHTMHHVNGWQTTNDLYLKEVKDCDEVIRSNHSSTTKKLFRPPYGRIRRSVIGELNSEFDIIMWTALSKDYDQSISPEKCLEETLKATEPGSIVLFHDSLKARKNLEYVLPRYLEAIYDRFEFDKL